MELLSTTTAVIDALGGTSATARLFGWKPQRVSNWKRLSNFPSDTYPDLSRALAERGFQAASHLWLTIPSAVLDNVGPVMPPGAVQARPVVAVAGASR